MRDFEQAKAEVFRRSDARIKRRKTIRRSVIACCVPLVFCVGLWSVTILPAMMPAKMADSAEAAVMSNGNSVAPEAALDYSTTKDNAAFAETSGTKGGAFVIKGKSHRISNEEAAIIVDILDDLEYDPNRVCRCLPQFKFESGAGSYGLHLDEGYARYNGGQASLTREQIQQIRKILMKYNLTIS